VCQCLISLFCAATPALLLLPAAPLRLHLTPHGPRLSSPISSLASFLVLPKAYMLKGIATGSKAHPARCFIRPKRTLACSLPGGGVRRRLFSLSGTILLY